MIVHELINVLIFAFLNLVDFDLHSEVKLSLKLFQFCFVIFDEAFFREIKLCLEVFNFFLELFFFTLYLSDVALFVDTVLIFTFIFVT